MSTSPTQSNGPDPFASFREPKMRRARGKCRRCNASLTGEAPTGRVVLSLQERTHHPEKQVGEANRWQYPVIDSKSVTVCASCAVEVYGVLSGALHTEVGDKL